MTSVVDLRVFDDYEQRLRAALAGLPAPDVDDEAAEVRSHLADEIADGRSPAEALAAFGDAETVARGILERRLLPDGGVAVPPASRVRRTLAWLADFPLAWGPLLVLPVWPALVGWWQDRFQLSAEQIATLGSEFGYTRPAFPFALTILAAAFAAWGLWYWRGPRARSASVGMRMAGISRLRVAGERLTVRTADVAESEPARIVSGTKWYLAVPTALLGVIVAAVGLEYALLTAGSIAQPGASQTESVRRYEDATRSAAVIDAFYEEVVAGDIAGARALAEPALASQVTTFAGDAHRLGVLRVDHGMNVGPDSYVMHEYYGDGRPRRTVVLTLSRHDEQPASATYATVYRISSIEVSATAP